jgi:RNase P protein component
LYSAFATKRNYTPSRRPTATAVTSLRIDAAIVWIARRPAATADFRELEKEMHTLIGRAELWK